MTLANKIMLQAGAGMLTITDAHMMEFNEQLLNYYNTGNPDELERFMYDNVIIGIEV